MLGESEKLFGICAIIVFTITAISGNSKTKAKIRELVAKPHWIASIILIICFSFYIKYTTEEKTQENRNELDALKKAIIALVIAIFSEIGLTIVPFWLVFMVAYLLEGWI